MSLSPAARIAGWAILVLAAPLAVFGSILSPNEYKAIGVDGLDCDGPLGVFLVALPGLAIYGAALVVNGRRWRVPINLAVAALSLAACLFLGLNVGRAMLKSAAQHGAC